MVYGYRRRRRKKKNYTGLIVTLLAIILAGLVAILLLAGKADKKPDTDVNTGSQQRVRQLGLDVVDMVTLSAPFFTYIISSSSCQCTGI